MVAPGRGVGHRLVPQVLQLLLCLVKHLHALCVLVLQLPQLQEKAEGEHPGVTHPQSHNHLTGTSWNHGKAGWTHKAGLAFHVGKVSRSHGGQADRH